MSRADKDCAMTEQDAVAADELNRFCQQLVHAAQFRFMRQFTSGSHVELAHSYMSMRACGMKMDAEDVDIMHYRITQYAFPLTQRVPYQYNGAVLRIIKDGVHPGYTRLIDERSGEYFYIPKYLYPYGEVRGPAHRHHQLLKLKNTTKQFAAEGNINLKATMPEQDVVAAVHSPYWPVEASEWITRTRRHACPSKSVIKQIVRYGCDFVGVAHKLSCNREKKNEWRFSFSMAELIIIRSWRREQRIAYRVLRHIYKMIAQSATETNNETVLCTFYFKTLMLWACEKRHKEFWAEHSLVQSIQQLLIEMAEWLTSKFCCNYFIRDNNMMDHLVDTVVSSDVNALRAVSTLRDLVAQITTFCSYDESFVTTITTHSELPAWILNSVRILDHVYNFEDNYQNLGSTHYTAELRTALVQELTAVYRGLASQREAVLCDASREKWLRRAKEHFSAATKLNECTERVDQRITESMHNVIGNLFAEYDSDYKVSSKRTAEHRDVSCRCETKFVSKHKDSKCVLYTRKCQASYRIREVLKQATTVIVYQVDAQSVIPGYNVYREWPGYSLTVNGSWFIAKAYLANIYYTHQRYKEAIQTCNEVVEVYKHSWGNEWFAERTFPVLLSTQWTAVYDAELQALLGLCSLCSFVSNRTDARSVCFAVCPVLFVLYLKLRCDIDRSDVACARSSGADFSAHYEECGVVIFRDYKLIWSLLVASLRSRNSSRKSITYKCCFVYV